MYIKDIAIGSEDNLKDMMLGVLDLDTTPIYSNSSHTSTVTPVTGASSMTFRVTSLQMGYNEDTIASIGLGNVLDERYSIFPFLIKFANSALGSGTSKSDIEFETVDLTEDPPDNWDLDRYQYYYVISRDGTDNKHHAAIEPAADWATLRASLIAGSQNLYRNTEIAKWVWIGSGDKKVCFILGRCDGVESGVSTDGRVPSANIYTRNYRPSSGNAFYFSGGYIRNGSNPDDPAAIPASSYGSGAFSEKYITNIIPGAARLAFSDGRFTSNVTNDNPICDCTMQQFGAVKYNNKSYFGVWLISYDTKYYWGYDRKSGTSSWTLANLDMEYPADYTSEMHKYALNFWGICLDDFDIEIDTREGEIPPEEDPDGNFNYPSFTHRFMDDASFGILAPAASAGLHVYRLTASAFSKLAAQIWSWGNIVNNVISSIEDKGLFSGAIDAVTSSIQQSRLSPSDCVVFARKMPYAVTNPPAGTLDIGFNLRLGGEYLDIIGDAYRRERICRTVVLDWSFTGPTQTFFDYSEYVGVSLYLPFIGSVSLPADCLMDGSMAINYAFDVISGQCTAMVITRSHDGREYTHGPYTGDPSVNIPLAVADSNIMGRQLATAKAAVNGIKGAVSGFAKGGLIGKGGAAASLIGAAGQIAEAQAAPAGFTSVTDLGSNTAICSPTDLMVQLTYPATVDLINTINLVGASAYRTGRISDYVSETGDNFAQFSFVDLSGIAATDTELAELESQLRQGVHL